jgi:UDP-GlcNAc:undecaprenyl-phosphate GlcNAc-1-phosphate transferase
MLDAPTERKDHPRPVPNIGGVALVGGTIVGTACDATLPFDLATVWLVGGSVLAVLGFLDDCVHIPWRIRLAVHFMVALAVTWRFSSPLLAWPIAVLWIVGLTNALNMLDNMDLLCAGTAVVACACLAMGRWLADLSPAPYPVLIGAALGFAWFNRPPARIFLGDSGSTFLGYSLGLLSLHWGILDAQSPKSVVATLAIVALPWYDLGLVVLLRLRQGRSPFDADRQHVSHRLVEKGLARPTAVAALLAVALLSGLAGVVLVCFPGPLAWATAAAILGGWVGFSWIEYPWRKSEVLSRDAARKTSRPK